MLIDRRKRECPEMKMEISEILSEYSIKDGEIYYGENGRKRLKGDVRNGNCNIDLTRGFSTNENCKVTHGVHFLYESFVLDGKEVQIKSALDRINPFCGSIFVCGRYLLNAIDEALWSSFRQFEIVGMKKNNMIFVGLNRDFASRSEREPSEEQKLSNYCGLNFAKCVTDEGEFHFPTFQDTHSVIRNMKLVDGTTNKEINILVSSTVRAFKNEEPVELHTRFQSLDEKFWNFDARKWWWRGKMSGSKTVLYGLRDQSQTVTTLNEIDVDSLLTPNWKYHPTSSMKLIHQIFTTMADELTLDDQLCSATFYGGSKIQIQRTPITFLNRSADW